MNYLNDFHNTNPRGGQGKTHDFVNTKIQEYYNNNLATKSVLEYGCGKGHAIEYYNTVYNTNITGYDPGIPKYSSEAWRKRYWDLIYSIDVLEHIPIQQLTGKAGELNWIAKGIRDRALIVIDLTPAKKTLSTGENAHVTLLSEDAWLTHIRDYFTVNTWEIDVQPDKLYGERRRLCVDCGRLRKM